MVLCFFFFFLSYCFSCWNQICILLCKRAVGQLWTTTCIMREIALVPEQSFSQHSQMMLHQPTGYEICTVHFCYAVQKLSTDVWKAPEAITSVLKASREALDNIKYVSYLHFHRTFHLGILKGFMGINVTFLFLTEHILNTASTLMLSRMKQSQDHSSRTVQSGSVGGGGSLVGFGR